MRTGELGWPSIPGGVVARGAGPGCRLQAWPLAGRLQPTRGSPPPFGSGSAGPRGERPNSAHQQGPAPAGPRTPRGSSLMATTNINFFIAYLLFLTIPHGPLVLAVIPKDQECQKASQHNRKTWLTARSVGEQASPSGSLRCRPVASARSPRRTVRDHETLERAAAHQAARAQLETKAWEAGSPA